MPLVKANLALAVYTSPALNEVDFGLNVYAPTLDGDDFALMVYTPPALDKVDFELSGGALSITPLAVAVSSALQAPSIKGTGSAPITLSPVARPSTVQAPSIRGTGVARIKL